jgi:hypothetical protein
MEKWYEKGRIFPGPVALEVISPIFPQTMAGFPAIAITTI